MTKVVIRVMAAGRQMLGSVVHHARIAGDGCVRASGRIACGIAVPGVPVEVSLHWCDVNVEVSVPLVGRPAAAAGEVLDIFAPNDVLIKVGEMPQALPPVVVGSAAVALPVGGLGARP